MREAFDEFETSGIMENEVTQVGHCRSYLAWAQNRTFFRKKKNTFQLIEPSSEVTIMADDQKKEKGMFEFLI